MAQSNRSLALHRMVQGELRDSGATEAGFQIWLRLHLRWCGFFIACNCLIYKVIAMKINCWEFKKCGRGENGPQVDDLGVCPASTEERLDGVHGGQNAGRACWVVAGSFCEGEIQGIYANKIENCRNCDFFLKVDQEEGFDIVLPMHLLEKINDK